MRFQLHGQGQIVGVDNGEQASRERYKEQADGSWIRKAFNGKGVVIVKSTEQAGKFTLTAHSDLLKSAQTTIFTGKKDQAEKLSWVQKLLKFVLLSVKHQKCLRK